MEVPEDQGDTLTVNDVRCPELVAPAGDFEKMEMAFAYGADAVYLAGEEFGLRARSRNFSESGILDAVQLAHDLGRRVYVTVNLYANDDDLSPISEFVEFLRGTDVDAVIVADAGVLGIVKEVAPEMRIHLSTQANTGNARAVNFWAGQGLSRVVIARELTVPQVCSLAGAVDTELEVFVHGSMCLSYSGRCYLSWYMTGRSANRGDCAHSCRYEYALMEELRPNERFRVVEEPGFTQLMSSKDLCLIEHLGALADAGVSAFKIEGRTKSVGYVATAVRVYREALDAWRADPGNYVVRPEWTETLEKASNRGFTADPTSSSSISTGHGRDYIFVGVVTEDSEGGRMKVAVRNQIHVGQEIEAFAPNGVDFTFRIEQMESADNGVPKEVAHPNNRIIMSTPQPVPKLTILRRKMGPQDGN
jgi:putative protease